MASLRAALAAVALLLTSCCSSAFPVFRAGPLGAASPPPYPAARVLVLGDFGARSRDQLRVAEGIRRYSAAAPFDLAMQVGDNLYYCGPEPLRPGAEACTFAEDGVNVATAPSDDDPAFAIAEDPLTGLVARDGAPMPVYWVLGNHDVGLTGGRCLRPTLGLVEAERRRACLEVAHQSAGWTMPARHFVLDRGPLRIIAIDSNVTVRDYGGFTLDDELAFVREATAPCAEPGRVCFIAGHHPPAAAWPRRSTYHPTHGRGMARLLEAAHGVRGFLAGHVHTLEHASRGDLEVFVSGSTATAGPPDTFDASWPEGSILRFATAERGFAALDVEPGGSYRVRFMDPDGRALHCCEAGTEGPCRPVVCE